MLRWENPASLFAIKRDYDQPVSLKPADTLARNETFKRWQAYEAAYRLILGCLPKGYQIVMGLSAAS